MDKTGLYYGATSMLLTAIAFAIKESAAGVYPFLAGSSVLFWIGLSIKK